MFLDLVGLSLLFVHSCQVYRIKMRENLTFYCFSFVVNTIGYCILLFIHRVKCGSLQLNAGNLATMFVCCSFVFSLFSVISAYVFFTCVISALSSS